MKRQLYRTLALVVTLTLTYSTSEAQTKEVDFNTRLMHKLSKMMRVEPPSRITIRTVSPQYLINWYKEIIFRNCMTGTVSDPFGWAVAICFQKRESYKGFIYGRWVRDDNNPRHLYVELLEKPTVETRVHEFLHWYLYYSTNPEGIVNSNEVINPMVNRIMGSPEFMKWLEENAEPGERIW